jgi:hypothetical protein
MTLRADHHVDVMRNPDKLTTVGRQVAGGDVPT